MTYDSKYVQTNASYYPKVVNGFKREAWIRMIFNTFSQSMIKALILTKMRMIIDNYFKESTSKANNNCFSLFLTKLREKQ